MIMRLNMLNGTALKRCPECKRYPSYDAYDGARCLSCRHICVMRLNDYDGSSIGADWNASVDNYRGEEK